MSYDITPYVTDVDEGWLWARVTWTPRGGGDTVTAESDYVDGRDGTTAHLGCGIEEALDALGLPQFNVIEKSLMVLDLINRQLAWRPWAELWCPAGTARLELIPPPS